MLFILHIFVICVVGIDGLITKLHDGQRVEVDGTAGVIRLLS